MTTAAPYTRARPDSALQKRGRQRIHAILDAAEAIMIEEGYEAATLKAISARTGIPTASMYHYFADRHQVDRALLARHVDSFRHLLAVSLQAVTDDTTIPDLVGAFLDARTHHFREHPICVELWTDHRSGHDAVIRSFHQDAAHRMHQIATQHGQLDRDTPEFVTALALHVGLRLFDLAFRRAPGGDDAVLAEAQLLISLYLKAYEPDRTSR